MCDSSKRPLSSPESQTPEPKQLMMDPSFEALKNIKNPQVKDIIGILFDIHNTGKENSAAIKVIQDQLKNLDTKVTNNSTSINKINEKIELQDANIELLHKKTIENNILVNRLSQIQVENEVLIQGFPMSPDVDYVVSNLLRVLNIQQAVVSYKYLIEDKKLKKYRITVGFTNTAHKIAFMKSAIGHGTIYLKEIIPELQSESAISISNKLSYFNGIVRGKLLGFRKSKHIKLIRFRNHFYEFKKQDSDEWTVVNNADLLRKLSAAFGNLH